MDKQVKDTSASLLREILAKEGVNVTEGKLAGSLEYF